MWLIEEYINKDRIWVWTIPIKAPTTKQDQIGMVNKKQVGWGLTKIKRGLIFWIVNKINKEPQERDSTIPGSHEWKGAAPNLIMIPTKMNKLLIVKSNGSTTPKRKKIEAKVWVRKYLIADSFEDLLFELRIKGINAKVFNSNPIHLNINEGEEVTIKILLIIHKKNKIIEGLINIGEKGNSYRWGMSPLA